MEYLYNLLGFLPENIQPPTIALIIIIVGYLISKILAGVIFTFISEEATAQATEALSLRVRLGRTCFWVSWLACILIGLNQLPLLSSALSKLLVNSNGFPMLIAIGTGAILLIISERWFLSLYQKVRNFLQPFPRIKINSNLQSLIIQLSWVFLAVICGFALDAPQTFGLKLIATILILLAGFFLSHVVKTAVSSLIGIDDHGSVTLPKTLSYIVLTAFVITSIEVWIA